MPATEAHPLHEALYDALRAHLYTEVGSSQQALSKTLSSYHQIAQRAGLLPLPKSTLEVLAQQNNDQKILRAELRALYLGILRVVCKDGTLEWDSLEIELCSKLQKLIRLNRSLNPIRYLLHPTDWHRSIRALLVSRSDLLLPLILFSDSDEIAKLLRRTLKVESGSTPATSYARLLDGHLTARNSRACTPNPA